MEECRQLLTPDALWGLAMIVAAWLLATVVGGPIGAAVNALLLAYGLYELWPVVTSVASHLGAWINTAYLAETEEALHLAARHFATALARGGLTTLEVLVTHRVFRGAAKKLRERFPAPDSLRQRYAEQEAQRIARATEERARRKRPVLEETLSTASSALLVPASQGAGRSIGGAVLGAVAAAALVAALVGAVALSPKEGR